MIHRPLNGIVLPEDLTLYSKGKVVTVLN